MRRAVSFALALGGLLWASSFAVSATCPYPLGDYLLRGDARIVNGSTDAPEQMLFDVTMVGGQYTAGQFGYDPVWPTRMRYAYETEYEYIPRNGTAHTEAHVVAYKEFSERTGWNTRPVFLSSKNVTDLAPVADSQQPTLVAFGGGVWVAWQVSGNVRDIQGRVNDTTFWPDDGAYVVLRGNTNGTWGPMQSLTPVTRLASPSVNIRPDSVATAAGAYFAYQTNQKEGSSDNFNIVGRPFNGAALGPVEQISAVGDGWSDHVVALATDGARVAAVWAAENHAAPELGPSEVWVGLRQATGGWETPVRVSPPNETDITHPTVAWYGDRFYIAWSAIDPALSAGGDRSIVMRSFDPATHDLSAPIAVAGAASPGDDSEPALTPYAGLLHIAWLSNSRLNGSADLSPRLATHLSTWDGSTLGPVALADQPDRETRRDLWPGFVVAGDALFLTYGEDFNTGTYFEHNQRQLMRQLERPGRWYDQLSATWAFGSPLGPGSGVALVDIRFGLAGTAPPPSEHYALRLGNGEMVRVPPGAPNWRARIPYEGGTFWPPGDAFWCGVPVALSQNPTSFDSQRGFPWLSLMGLVVLGALVLAGVVVWRRRRGSPARAPPKRSPGRRRIEQERAPVGDADDSRAGGGVKEAGR